MYFNIIISHASRSPKCSFLCTFPDFSCVQRFPSIPLYLIYMASETNNVYEALL